MFVLSQHYNKRGVLRIHCETKNVISVVNNNDETAYRQTRSAVSNSDVQRKQPGAEHDVIEDFIKVLFVPCDCYTVYLCVLCRPTICERAPNNNSNILLLIGTCKWQIYYLNKNGLNYLNKM